MQFAFDDVEKFIVVVVFVPVVFALNDSDSDDRVVDETQGLVEPRTDRTGKGHFIDQFERPILDIQVSIVVGHVWRIHFIKTDLVLSAVKAIGPRPNFRRGTVLLSQESKAWVWGLPVGAFCTALLRGQKGDVWLWVFRAFLASKAKADKR
jgi:hypothetical protein